MDVMAVGLTPLSMSAVTAAWIWSRRNVMVRGASGRERASAANESDAAHQVRYSPTASWNSLGSSVHSIR